MVRITCLGIAVLDLIMQVDEMPHLADKYRAKAVKLTGGGLSGNAATACARLGAKTRIITRIGDDLIGDMILKGLEKEGIDISLCRNYAAKDSPISAIFVDNQGERMIMSHSDENIEEDAAWLPVDLASTSDAVCGDTRWETGALTLFNQARAAQIPSLLDADRGPKNKEVILAASHVGFSARGLREFTHIQELDKALAEAMQLSSHNFLCVTDGANGVWYGLEGRVKNLPAFNIKAVDTLGAGDTWHGALAVALAEKQPIEQALRFANATAALKCLTFGGREGIPKREAVEVFLKGA
jgi:sulfofructose kinase